MLSASLRAYRLGPETLAARRLIVVDYLNSVPLAAAPEHGEVHGLGRRPARVVRGRSPTANRALADEGAPVRARAQVYKQILALILSARRPSYYLVEDQEALETFTDSYLRLMSEEGIIDGTLRDAALAQRLEFRTRTPSSVDYAERKAANVMRARLSSLLAVPALYDLDRLDVTARSTLVEPAQESVTRLLRSLRDPKTVQALGLKGLHLLDDRGDPARVIYSFTLYEKTPGANRVRVQTDSFDQPFDINAGARLDLGSSAKLRTLITYLEVVSALHARFAPLAPDELRAIEVHRRDQLTAWAVEYLGKARDKGLRPMLDASMERRYSASPGRSSPPAGACRPSTTSSPRKTRASCRCAMPFAIGQPRVHPAPAGRRAVSPLPGARVPRPHPGRPDGAAPRGVPHTLRRPRRQRVDPPVLPEIPGQDRGGGPRGNRRAVSGRPRPGSRRSCARRTPRRASRTCARC